MSVLKKVAAVGLGTVSLVGGAITLAAKQALQNAGEKAGKSGFTDSHGRTFTKNDYDGLANKCNDDIFKKGIKQAVKLWKDDL